MLYVYTNKYRSFEHRQHVVIHQQKRLNCNHEYRHLTTSSDYIAVCVNEPLKSANNVELIHKIKASMKAIDNEHLT